MILGSIKVQGFSDKILLQTYLSKINFILEGRCPLPRHRLLRKIDILSLPRPSIKLMHLVGIKIPRFIGLYHEQSPVDCPNSFLFSSRYPISPDLSLSSLSFFSHFLYIPQSWDHQLLPFGNIPHNS